MFFGIDALFSTRLPHRFECGFIDFESDNGGRGGPGGGKGGGGVGGGDHGTSGSSGSSSGGSRGGGGDRGGGLGGERSASGRTGINGSINGGLADSQHTRSQHSGDYDSRGNYTGGSNRTGGVGSHGGFGSNIGNGMYGVSGFGISAGMNPDARDDPSRKGIDGMGQGLSGTSGGLSNRSLGDSLSLGFAQLSADPVGYASHVARENGWRLAGGLAGFALGGVPGAYAGQKIGSIADDFGNLTNADIASRTLGGLSAFGTPAAKMASAIASTAIDPDTKLLSHLASIVGAGLGGQKLGGKYGAMAGAEIGQAIGNLAPAGEMNPRNSDLSSADNGIAAVGANGGMQGSGESAWGGIAASNVSAIGDSTALVANRAKAIRQAGQWQDYQDRFHS